MKQVLAIAFLALLLSACSIGSGRGPANGTSFLSGADLVRCERCFSSNR